MINKIKKIYQASKLCLKYPFLYPRNRFDDKHHVYIEWLQNLQLWLYKKSYFTINISARLSDEEYAPWIKTPNFEVSISPKKLIFVRKNHTYSYDLVRYLYKDCYIKGIKLCNSTRIEIGMGCHNDTNYGFPYSAYELPKNKFYILLHKAVKWANQNIGKVLFLPSYTEADACPEGWKNIFFELCDGIKKELHGNYKSFRITQVKEKYGTLRFYINAGSSEIYQLIHKAEEKSATTCICCGKPAKYISLGWISPYCKDCMDFTWKYKEIKND